jgi:hypothetical protein
MGKDIDRLNGDGRLNEAIKKYKTKYVRLIRDAAKHVVHFAVDLGHFTLDSSLRLAESRLEQRHLFACYLTQMVM